MSNAEILAARRVAPRVGWVIFDDVATAAEADAPGVTAFTTYLLRLAELFFELELQGLRHGSPHAAGLPVRRRADEASVVLEAKLVDVGYDPAARIMVRNRAWFLAQLFARYLRVGLGGSLLSPDGHAL